MSSAKLSTTLFISQYLHWILANVAEGVMIKLVDQSGCGMSGSCPPRSIEARIICSFPGKETNLDVFLMKVRLET